jgi:[ribosomal protein S5]-alanine N-acetyltransferase
MSAASPIPGPFLDGRQLYLRGILPSDLNGNYFRWFNDREICRFNSHGRFPMSPEALESYYRQISSSKTDLVLAIVQKSSGSHVGNISLQSIHWLDRSAEYAIVIGEREAWGKGIGKEASNLLVDHGFMELNLHRIHCGTSQDNEAMQRLAAHMGMREEGRRREAIWKHGAFHDIVEYGLLRSEWLQRREHLGLVSP